jgi:glycosyltransferase involved in cell wall biosynthesis
MSFLRAITDTSATTMPSLSVFFPCYNDAATIGGLIAAADVVASRFTDDYEIIVVDDASIDASRQVLHELQSKYSRLRVVHHTRNRGYGGALRSGFAHATKDLVFYTDGDGQYDVFDLERLLPIMQDGIDVVNGYKIVRRDPAYRVVVGALYLHIMRLLFNFHVRDVDCDFRLLRRSVFEAIELHHNSGVICVEMVKKLERAGFRFAEYPVHHYERVHGASQFFRPRRLVRTALGVGRLWWELMICRRSPRAVVRRLAEAR